MLQKYLSYVTKNDRKILASKIL